MEPGKVINGRVQRRRGTQSDLEHFRQFLKDEAERRERGELTEEEKRMDAAREESERKFKAEKDRREALSQEDRLREDGQMLQSEIEADYEMLAFLERSASQRAQCRAGDDCLDPTPNSRGKSCIADEYRICLTGVRNDFWYGRKTDYYHVLCFSHMMDLHTLIPSKLKLAGAPEQWPLMVQKWYEHKECIDPDKIAEHIDKLEAYVAARKEFRAKEAQWQQNHKQSCSDKAESKCTCPEKPKLPPMPILENSVVDETEMCCLADVLDHPGCRFVRDL